MLNDPTEQQNVAFDNTDQLNTMKALFDELAESIVPADEPFGVSPNVYINDGYLADGWCKEEDLYFDPCTSGPCSGAGKQKSVVLAERAKRRYNQNLTIRFPSPINASYKFPLLT